MPIVLDGTNGIDTPDLASAGPITGTTGTFSGAVQASGVTTNLYPLVSGTAVASTSGTSIDFTGIPSWVKRITVMLSGVSLSSTANILIQLGTGGTLTTTGYSSTGGYISTPNGAGSAGGSSSTSGFIVQLGAAAYSYFGNMVFTNISGNIWVGQGVFSNISQAALVAISGGGVTLAGALNIVRITTVNGTDTFDAGSINILYE